MTTPSPDVHDRRPLITLLVANTISQLGNSFAFLAIPWFVLATTDSAAQVGLTVAVVSVPAIVVGLLGGAVVDRLGYRQTSIVSDIASGVTTLLIPLLYFTVGLPFWGLLTLVFLGAILDGPGNTARAALYPDLIARSGMAMDRANAAFSTTSRVAGVLGPPLAGVLIAVVGPANLLWVNAASFAISALLVRLRVPDAAPATEPRSGGGIQGYVADVREGFRFLRHDGLLLGITLSLALGVLIAEPFYGVILPVYANEVLDSPAQLGLIFAGLGAGSIIGNLVFVAIARRVSRRTIYYGGFLVRALCLAVMLTMPPWWVIAGAIVIGAIAFEPINPTLMAIRQERVPAGMRGRVFGAMGALGMMAQPVGLLGYGFLLEAMAIDGALRIFVLLNLALPVALLLIRALRRMDERPAQPA
ncbi:MAG TPA: MFS transporter [Thermomicrobiales bacterium]|nr:MFS transporter [Thermomicrobiales bacterium]